MKNLQLFDQNHGLTPLDRCFRCSERLVGYIKRRKSFFGDLFSQYMTWEYRGIQGVTGGYKGL